MRGFALLAATALLVLGPAGAWATGPSQEMNEQMQEWVDYKRPPFEPVKVQADGVKLTVLDATIESHALDDETTIVRVIMRAQRDESPAVVRRAVLKAHDGTSYPVSYVKAPPLKLLEEQGFKAYSFRLPETDQEELKSLEVTVASAKESGELASTRLELSVGEQVRFSDLDFATFSALPAFFMFFYYLVTTSSAF